VEELLEEAQTQQGAAHKAHLKTDIEVGDEVFTFNEASTSNILPQRRASSMRSIS